MSKRSNETVQEIHSIPQLHKLPGLPEPEHPLVSVNGLIRAESFTALNARPVVYHFYSICIKKNFEGKVKYRQTYYDHDACVLSFYARGQVTATEVSANQDATGEWLIFHPDLVRPYPLFDKIKTYGFFAYAIQEALHLSAQCIWYLTLSFVNRLWTLSLPAKDCMHYYSSLSVFLYANVVVLPVVLPVGRAGTGAIFPRPPATLYRFGVCCAP